jgi:hypothetical protein
MVKGSKFDVKVTGCKTEPRTEIIWGKHGVVKTVKTLDRKYAKPGEHVK